MESVVIKMGYLIKIKTNKKKYFVLRESCGSSLARLEYYDSEKQFKNGLQPKRSIILKDCFSINRKIDARNKHSFALYTRDDCFSVGVDNESQLRDWLDWLIDLYSSNRSIVYDYIWQVSIIMKDLGKTHNMIGVYRLCLTAQTLYIVKLDPQSDKHNAIEILLTTIRRCGNSRSCAFFLELGRYSSIGEGYLWIQAKDSFVARDMHKVVLNAMKCLESTMDSQRMLFISQTIRPSVAVNTDNQTTKSVCHPRLLHNYNIEHNRNHSVVSYERTIPHSQTNNNSLSSSLNACLTDSDIRSLSIDDNENTFLSMRNTIMRSNKTLTGEEEDNSDGYLNMELNNGSKPITSSKINMNVVCLNNSNNSSNTHDIANQYNYQLMNGS